MAEKIKIDIEANGKSSQAELNKTTEAVNDTAKATENAGSSFSRFGASASLAVSGIIQSLSGAISSLYQFAKTTLGLTVALDTGNVKLKIMSFLIQNIRKEFTISLSPLKIFADFLRRIEFPITPLIKFIDLMSEFRLKIGIGGGGTVFDSLKEKLQGVASAAGDVAKSGLVEFFKHTVAGIIVLTAKLAIFAAQLKQSFAQEKTFADASRMFEGTREEIDALKIQLEDLATQKLDIPIEEINHLAKIAGSMGISAKGVAEFIEISSKAALSFGLPAEEMMQQLGAIKASLGITGSELVTFTDQVKSAADSAKGASTELGILQVLTQGMAAVGKQFGFSAGETVAFSSAMIDAGVSVNVAATSLGSFLSTLQNAKNQNQDFQNGLSQLGTSSEKLAEDIKANPVKAVTDLLTKINQLSGEARGDVLQNLIGSSIDQKAAISQLTTGLDGLKQQIKATTDETIYADGVSEAYAKKIETADAKLEMLKNSIKILAAALANPFLPIIKLAVGALTSFTDWLRRAAENNPFLEILLRSISIFLSLGSAIKLTTLLLIPLVSAFKSLGIMLAANRVIIIATATALWGKIAATYADIRATIAAAGATGALSLTLKGLTATILAAGRAFTFLVGGSFGLIGIALTTLAVGLTYAADKFEWFKDTIEEPVKPILAEETAIVQKLDKNLEELRKSAEQTKQDLAESFEQIKERLTQIIDANKADYERDLSNLEDIEKSKLALIESSIDDRSKIEQQSSEFLLQSNADKLALTKSYHDNTIRLVSDIYDKEIIKAKGNKEVVEKLTKELGTAKKKTLTETETFYKTSIGKLIDLEKSLRDKAKGFYDDSVKNKKDALDKIKALETQGLGDKVASAEREKQIKKISNELDIAIAQKDYVKAAELSKKKVDLLTAEAGYQTELVNKKAAEQTKEAADLDEIIRKREAVQGAIGVAQGNGDAEKVRILSEEYKKLSDDIKTAQENKVKLDAVSGVQRTDQDVASEGRKYDAIAKANQAIEEQAVISQSLSDQQTAEADKVKTQIEQQKIEREAVVTQLKEVDTFLSTPKPLVIETADALKKAQELKEAIDEAVAERTLVVNGINTTTGNKPTGYATGGLVGGTGTSDTELSLLTPNEYVLTVPETKMLSKTNFGSGNFFKMLKSGELFKKPQMFSTGGFVKPSSFSSPSLSGGNKTSGQTVNFNLNLLGKTFSGVTDNKNIDILKELSIALEKQARITR